jgi:hypothetical protein
MQIIYTHVHIYLYMYIFVQGNVYKEGSRGKKIEKKEGRKEERKEGRDVPKLSHAGGTIF